MRPPYLLAHFLAPRHAYGADPNIKSSMNDMDCTGLMVASIKGDVQVTRA